MVTLKPYPAYKDSGLLWLGKIPAHWEIRRNGRLFAQRVETGFPDLPILEVSLKTGVRVRDLDDTRRKQLMSHREQYKRAVRGDIAYNMMRMWQGAVGVAPTDGLVSPAYVVAHPFPETETYYYGYLFRTAAYMNEVNKYSRGIVTDRNRLYWDEFKQMPSIYPTPDEQWKIAAVLGSHERTVRRFIRAKRRLIELLNEQKQAIIHRAVTRGLDPNVRLKPSGMEWLGDVPEHWEVKRLKTIANVRYGLGQPPRESEAGLPLIRATNVDHGRIVEKDLLKVDPEDVPKTRSAFLSEDEIVVVRSGAYTADSAIIPKKYAGAVAGYDMVVTPRKVRPDFMALALLSTYVRDDQLIIASMRSAQPHLNAEELGVALVMVPPETEQVQIIAYVASATRKLDAAVKNAEREIALLREYRTRLIADVVTGKLDVRGVALPEPEEVEEQEDWDQGVDVESEEIADVEEAVDADE
jgi:type I restriction enzyme, S subunit